MLTHSIGEICFEGLIVPLLQANKMRNVGFGADTLGNLVR